EYYLQFADHYFRVLNENRARFEEQNQQRRPRFENDEFGDADEATEVGADEAIEGEPMEARRDEREAPRQQDREPRRRGREDGEAGAEREAPRGERSEEDASEGRGGRRSRRPRGAEGETNGEAAPQRIEIDRLRPALAAAEPEAARAVEATGAEGEPA